VASNRGVALLTADVRDLSVLKKFALRDLANHANFGLPVTGLASPGFGRIQEASSPLLV
jgi:hypothetical protein